MRFILLFKNVVEVYAVLNRFLFICVNEENKTNRGMTVYFSICKCHVCKDLLIKMNLYFFYYFSLKI